MIIENKIIIIPKIVWILGNSPRNISITNADRGSIVKISATTELFTPLFWADVCEKKANAVANKAVIMRVSHTTPSSSELGIQILFLNIEVINEATETITNWINTRDFILISFNIWVNKIWYAIQKAVTITRKSPWLFCF